MGHAFAPSGEINNSDSDLAKDMMCLKEIVMLKMK